MGANHSSIPSCGQHRPAVQPCWSSRVRFASRFVIFASVTVRLASIVLSILPRPGRCEGADCAPSIYSAPSGAGNLSNRAAFAVGAPAERAADAMQANLRGLIIVCAVCALLNPVPRPFLFGRRNADPDLCMVEAIAKRYGRLVRHRRSPLRFGAPHALHIHIYTLLRIVVQQQNEQSENLFGAKSGDHQRSVSACSGSSDGGADGARRSRADSVSPIVHRR